jgi:riboflavin kinase/FMN adenylyltransferase
LKSRLASPVKVSLMGLRICEVADNPSAMRIIRDYQFVEPRDRGACAAIGNFDGVHLGHQSVIDLARKTAPDAPLGILTFEPHPRQYFGPDASPFRLMSRAAKASRLAKLGVERLYELNFNTSLAGLTPEAFAQNVISDGLGLAHVLVGADFCFGRGRAGTTKDLKRFGEQMGFGVTVAELLEGDAGQVSSTNIRQALSDGRPRDAKAMLGHWHRIEGVVIGGEQRGRELGYPTANMSIDGLHPPRLGVYAVLVDVQNGPHRGSYCGAASLGVRPMFGVNKPNLETFLFDFKGDLYGSSLSIGLVEYLRPEVKFDGLDALITQMDADCEQARQILDAL